MVELKTVIEETYLKVKNIDDKGELASYIPELSMLILISLGYIYRQLTILISE